MEELLMKGLIGKLGFEWGEPVFFLAMVFCIVVPYLLGSISFAVVFSKVLHHDDVREHGSGNAGSTNMLRTYGLKAALFTFLCDFLKGVISALLGFLILPYYTGFAYISALMCMLGHGNLCGCASRFESARLDLAFAYLRFGRLYFPLRFSRLRYLRGGIPDSFQYDADYHVVYGERRSRRGSSRRYYRRSFDGRADYCAS